MQNIQQIGSFPSLGKPIIGRTYDNPYYLKVVDHALHRFLDTNEFNSVTTDFRRSKWSETALEVDIQKLNSAFFKVKKDEHYFSALNEVNRRFRPASCLKPVHFTDLRAYPWQLSSSIGAPFATSEKWRKHVQAKFELSKIKEHNELSFVPIYDNRMTKHNLYNEMFEINRFKIHNIKRGILVDEHGHDYRYWHTAFARQHLVKSDDPDKVRLVFGAPSLSLMAELTFIWPIEVTLLTKGLDSPMLWGFETITGGWYRLRNWFSTKHPRCRTFITLDWSGFDRDARHSIIRDIHEMWRSWFDFEHGYWPTSFYPETKTDPWRLQNLWNWMTDSVLTTPLMLPNGDTLQFQHSGIYSGYFQTQLLDSFYNAVMVFTILSRMGFDISKLAAKFQGDDSIIGILNIIPQPFHSQFLSLFEEYAKEYFGARLSLKKSEVSNTLENLEVLRYRNTGGIPYRPELELLAMLRFPERDQSLESLMARSIGISFANCGRWHRVYLICEDIYNYLHKSGFSPDARGLPEGIRFKANYIPGSTQISLNHFPTYFETISHLTESRTEMRSERHWPSYPKKINDFYFIGIPS